MISIIIPNYNARQHLENCLASLFNLSFPLDQIEIVVVDNGSTDDSVAAVEAKFPSVRIVRSDTNLGFGVATNLGVQHASGEYVAFLNNDMVVHPDWLTGLWETMQQASTPTWVGSKVVKWDGLEVDFFGRPEDAFNLSLKPTRNFSMADFDPPYFGLFVSGGASLIRRDIFLDVGGFDPLFFLYHEDVDLGWRLWMRGYECAFTPDSIVYHHQSATSRTLPPAFVHKIIQKHVLQTCFKNLEDRIIHIFPLVFFALLDQAEMVEQYRNTLLDAFEEFIAVLPELFPARDETQRKRVCGDIELFSRLEQHPFHYLFTQHGYQNLLQELFPGDEKPIPDLSDPIKAENVLRRWLGEAQFVYAKRLYSAYVTHRQRADQINKEVSEAFARGQQVHAKLHHEYWALRKEISQQAIALQSQELTIEDLSDELAIRTQILNRITSDPYGWALRRLTIGFKYHVVVPVLKRVPFRKPGGNDR